MSNLVDSHAHLDLCGDPAAAVSESLEHGVSRILAVGFDMETSRKAVALAKAHPQVLASVGIHPHDATSVDDAALAELSRLAAEPEVVAIGETGLDFFRDRSPRDSQMEAFLRHIELARETGLTLMVHSREAPQETLATLEEHSAGLRVVIHCFSLYDHVQECAGHRYFMSVAGNVTFPKATELRDAATRIPDDLLLTETDSPWLAPVPHRGKPNSPANIRFILEELALLRRIPVAALARQVSANFETAFGLA
ncbi:MAG: TatD family hydrolase [Pseudomonadota bacterium]